MGAVKKTPNAAARTLPTTGQWWTEPQTSEGQVRSRSVYETLNLGARALSGGCFWGVGRRIPVTGERVSQLSGRCANEGLCTKKSALCFQ